MTILLFWVVTPCRQGGRYQSFGEIYCLCLQLVTPCRLISRQSFRETYHLHLQVVLPCRLTGRYQRFGETYCLRFQGWIWRQYVSPKRWYLRISLHGITTQNIVIFTAENSSLITTDVRIANNLFENRSENPLNVSPDPYRYTNQLVMLTLKISTYTYPLI
jgi:hypothetical protein